MLNALTLPTLGITPILTYKSTPMFQTPFTNSVAATLSEGLTFTLTGLELAGYAPIIGSNEGKVIFGFVKSSDVAIVKDQMRQPVRVKKATIAYSGPSEKFVQAATLAEGTQATALQNSNGFYRIDAKTWVKVIDTETVAGGSPIPFDWKKYIPYALGGAAIIATIFIATRKQK
jgi:nucleoid-associated protein YgaU